MGLLLLLFPTLESGIGSRLVPTLPGQRRRGKVGLGGESDLNCSVWLELMNLC